MCPKNDKLFPMSKACPIKVSVTFRSSALWAPSPGAGFRGPIGGGGITKALKPALFERRFPGGSGSNEEGAPWQETDHGGHYPEKPQEAEPSPFFLLSCQYLQLTESTSELRSLGNVPCGAVQSKGRSWYEVKLAANGHIYHEQWRCTSFYWKDYHTQNQNIYIWGYLCHLWDERIWTSQLTFSRLRFSWKLGVVMWSTSQGCNYQGEECVCACLSNVDHHINTVTLLLKAEQMLWRDFHPLWESGMKAPPSTFQRRTRMLLSYLTSLHLSSKPELGKPGWLNNGITHSMKHFSILSSNKCWLERLGDRFWIGTLMSGFRTCTTAIRHNRKLYINYKVRSLVNIVSKITSSFNIPCLSSDYHNFLFRKALPYLEQSHQNYKIKTSMAFAFCVNDYFWEY